MKTRIEDISNYLGKALFIVLFFFIVAAFSDRSNQQSIKPVPHELVSEWLSKSAQAVNTDAVQLPLFQKSLVSFVDQKFTHLYNVIFKQSADNRMIAQRFFSLHQTELVIKPFAMSRFYYHLFPKVAEDVPVLS
ncbi:MAG TPA: hypothetical protein VFC67_28505 [Prolixibacteraceae bacterium]|nr:hypothetical protein [Prolixibacteraceae bacterium]